MIVDRYYYAQLNKQEQAVYKAFYNGLMAHEDVIPIPIKGQLSKEVFNKIFRAMTRDNPLIYYVNQSACNWATDAFGHTAICPQYFYSKETVRKYNRNIENTVNNLAAQLKLTEGTDYEKEIRVHDWFCKNVKYDFKGSDMDELARVVLSHNIVGVFAKQKAQCEGIAKAVKVLLNAVDVKCIVVTGDSVKSGQSVPHAWNIVNIGEEPYQLDVTWDIGAMGQSKHHIAHDYFNLTDELMNQDHKADSSLPECKSKKANYYVQRGCSFQMRHRLMAYIDRLIEKNERNYGFRAEGRLNKVAIEKEVADHIVQKLHEQGRSSVGIKTCSNRELGIYRIEIS